MVELGYQSTTQYDLDRDLRGIADELATQTRLADEAGFAAFGVGEHHVTDSHQYLLNESVLAHVAEHVGDMDLWAAISLLPLHNPVRIAELGATLDVLTGGQFRMGVGLGYRQDEFDAFGVDPADAPGRLSEGVEIIKRLWTEDDVSFDGEHFQLEDVSIRPQPLQEPRPHVWSGASNETSVRRAARVADAFLGAHVPFDLAERQIADFRDERERRGLEPGHVGFIREAYVAPTTEEAEAIVREPLMHKYESYSSWGQDDIIGGDDFDSPWDKLRNERFLVGTPAEVLADVERYVEAMDLDILVVRTQFPGADLEDVRRSIELFGDEVVPHLPD
jgi:alkanesulfonate monooxygenase SsuD/methylene tetrahydromethanopterin reductase-like flavin-dependent oxidoreductase (luciferase family)